MQKLETERIVNFIYEFGSLQFIPRAHKQTLFIEGDSDNILAHTGLTTLIGYALAHKENANTYKVMLMTIFYDFPETRSSDHNWIHKKYVKIFEDEIIQDQLEALPFSGELMDIVAEYNTRETLEAKVAKDADSLAQIYSLQMLAMKGNEEAKRWLISKPSGRRLYTNTAKEWVIEICKQTPSAWWKDIWTDKNR